MNSPLPTRSAARILVDQLLVQETTTVFCVPGESYLPVLDALYESADRIRLVVNRHESGAGFMADAWGKLTGQPGICMVTRGPGATNASIAVHTAMQDSSPMILFIGQVGGDCNDREAFQEVDYRAMFGPLAKWVAQIERADRIPEYIARAYQVATSGRMGPVVLALPEDLLNQSAAVADAQPHQPLQAAVAEADLTALAERLAAARHPLLLLGGTGWTPAACRDVENFVDRFDLPVACSFRRQDLFDNRNAHYIGDVGIGINPKLFARIRAADLVIAIGARLGEMTTSGYTLFDIPSAQGRQTLVHVHPDAGELGRVVQADLAIVSGMPAIAAALTRLETPATRAWHEDVVEARAQYEAWQAEPSILRERPAALNLHRMVAELFARLPENTVLCNGAGNFATWGHRFRRYPGLARGHRTQLAPTSGAMGYGVPAGVAAKIHDSAQNVVVFAGDGDFMMTGQELATAVQEDAPVLFIVFNNGMYGTIRMHQERTFPGRVHGTGLSNPDFVALARAYGAFATRVDTIEAFAPALESALGALNNSRVPALIELRTDPEIISPGATITSLRKRS